MSVSPIKGVYERGVAVPLWRRRGTWIKIEAPALIIFESL
jgi:hypothetical protein